MVNSPDVATDLWVNIEMLDELLKVEREMLCHINNHGFTGYGHCANVVPSS
jgi:hypothetical protein